MIRTLAILATLLAASPVPAPAATDTGPPASAESAKAPDDSELNAFVQAFVRMIGVQHAYLMLMQAEPDPARVEELKHGAIVDMTEAIERDGMSVERYNTIALAVRDDAGLQGRVEAILEQLAAQPDEE